MTGEGICQNEQRLRTMEIELAVAKSDISKVKSDVSDIKEDTKEIKKSIKEANKSTNDKFIKIAWGVISVLVGIIIQIFIK